MAIVRALRGSAPTRTLLRPAILAAAIVGGLGLGALGSVGTAEAAGGCGPGFHPNPWGVCRPNYGWGRGGYYRRPVVVYGGYGYARPRPYYRPYGFYGPRPYY